MTKNIYYHRKISRNTLMNQSSLKNILSVIITITTIEALSYYTGLPFTVIDVILIPMSALLIAFGAKSLFIRVDNNEKTYKFNHTLFQLISYLLMAIFIFTLGLWSVITGWKEPLALYTGVKGSAHGYTLICLGLLLSGYSAYFTLNLISNIREKCSTNR